MSAEASFSVRDSSSSAIVSSPQELESIINPNPNPTSDTNPSSKKKRNLPRTPDPDAEVIALSPRSLTTKNRFICEICSKGFQREQNLQLHRRGHNLPWKLKQRSNKDRIKKKVYVCPETTCVHHDPGRALGDLTGVKKHFSRKHGEKKWKCDKCGKKYAVQSDWKAHSKICGTREYKCDCGTVFSRKDSFTTHRAFCDALAEERSKITSFAAPNFTNHNNLLHDSNLMSPHVNRLLKPILPLGLDYNYAINPNHDHLINLVNDHDHHSSNLFMPSNSTDQYMQMAPNDDFCNSTFSPPPFSATSLLQKAAEMGFARRQADAGEGPPSVIGSSASGDGIINRVLDHRQSMVQSSADNERILQFGFHSSTRDFLGMGGGGARPFLPQETAGFASMSHFRANDH